MNAAIAPEAKVPAIAVGDPVFPTAHLENARRECGLESAWRQALSPSEVDSRLSLVRGPFAVGLHLADGHALGAVDRFAIRSLCYRVIQGQIHFAERADSLAALHPKAPLDPQALFDYLYFHVIPSPRTAFQGVFRIPAGHRVSFAGGQTDVRAYWRPHFTEPAHADFGRLAETFRTTVRQAVERQLDGSKPACFLSGGTDSSTVAGMIAQVAGRASTYSIGFDAEGYDEMQFARIAARRFGTDHHEYYVKPDDLVRSIPAVAAHYDQPFGNSSVLPAFYCARMAGDDGVMKLLAGDGGDELFGGNSRYAKQRVFGWYDTVPGAVRRGLLEPVLQRTPLGGLPLARKGRSYIEQARVPLPDRLQMYNLLLRLGTDDVLEPSFLQRIDTSAPLQHQRSVWRGVPETSALNRMLAYDWRYTLAEADLPKVCGSTSLAGVAVGFPFLDDALLDFSLHLPASYKLRGLKLRWFFKEALRGFLPDEIITKKKQGFGLPFGVWACRDEGLRGFAEEALGSLANRGIVKASFITRLLQDLLPTHPGYYGEMVWILMMLEHWLRAHPGHDWH